MQLFVSQSEAVCCCVLLCTAVYYCVLLCANNCVRLCAAVYCRVLLCTTVYSYVLLCTTRTVYYNIRLRSAGLQSAAANVVYVFLVTPLLRFANPAAGGLEPSPRSQAGND